MSVNSSKVVSSDEVHNSQHVSNLFYLERDAHWGYCAIMKCSNIKVQGC